MTSLLGANAALLDHERLMIVNGTASIIARTDLAMMQRLETIAGPGALVIGLGLWAIRVYGTRAVAPRRQEARHTDTVEASDGGDVRASYANETVSRWLNTDWGGL